MSQDPIKFYAWPTPNAFKVSIMFEETGLPYEVIPLNIKKGDQHSDQFKKLNPNSKMPVIIDPESSDGQPVTIFESGAILIYLGEKTGQFYPTEERKRMECLQWLMWQMAGFGPMLGQAHHFRQYAPEKIDYGIKRYTQEASRLYDVLEDRLSQSPYVGGPEYSIVDMAIYPWARSSDKQGVDLTGRSKVKKWMETIAERRAVQKGLKLMEEEQADSSFSEEERKQLFGT
jgi:GST-like protein